MKLVRLPFYNYHSNVALGPVKSLGSRFRWLKRSKRWLNQDTPARGDEAPHSPRRIDDDAREELAQRLTQRSLGIGQKIGPRREFLKKFGLGALLVGGSFALGGHMSNGAEALPGPEGGGTTISDEEINTKVIAGIRIASEYASFGAGTPGDPWPISAIQNAIDDLPTTGGKVFIPEGRYQSADTISLPDDIAIILEGAGYGTYIRSTNATGGNIIERTGSGVMTGGAILNMLLGGVSGGGDGIYLNRWNRGLIQNVSVESCGANGIVLNDNYFTTLSAVYSWYNRNGSGLVIQGDCNMNHVDGCMFSGNTGGDGVRIVDGDAHGFYTVTCELNDGWGFNIQDGYRHTFVMCDVEVNTTGGYRIDAGAENSFIGCTANEGENNSYHFTSNSKQNTMNRPPPWTGAITDDGEDNDFRLGPEVFSADFDTRAADIGKAPWNCRIIDCWVHCTETNSGGQVTLYQNGNQVSDGIACDTDGRVTRALVLDSTYFTMSQNGTIRVMDITNNAKGTIYVRVKYIP